VALRDHLWDRHRIRVRPIRQSGVSGIRVSPSVYTTLPELDRFTEIMTDLIRNGIPIS
jgi:selenocysteine lyase/cysteine desulfurase